MAIESWVIGGVGLTPVQLKSKSVLVVPCGITAFNLPLLAKQIGVSTFKLNLRESSIVTITVSVAVHGKSDILTTYLKIPVVVGVKVIFAVLSLLGIPAFGRLHGHLIFVLLPPVTVSYTHLDVYKRQEQRSATISNC